MSIGSFFGNLFSGVGSAVGGFFSTVKAYIMVAIVVLFVLLVGSFYWYYNWSQDKLQAYAASQAQLEDAIAQQKNAFDQLQKDTATLEKSYKDLQAKENQIQKENDLLFQEIRNYDFQNNAVINHDSTEKTINNQSDQLLKDFENLSDPNNLTSPGVQPSPQAKSAKGK